MSLVGELAIAAVAAWTGLYAAISGVAVARSLLARRRGPAHAPKPSQSASILLIRPCTGADAYLWPALLSVADAHGLERVRVQMTAESASDPAWPVICRSAQALRDRGIRAEAKLAPTQAYNRKVGQLQRAAAEATEDILACVDADVSLRGFDFGEFVAPLAEASDPCGAVWAPPVEIAQAETWGDRASSAVLGASLHAFALLGELDDGGLVGKTFAVRRDALRDAGGFGSLGDYLGEDMELARRLAERGWPTRMQPRSARSIASSRSLHEALARYTRWLWVIRAQRPELLASYPLLLAAAPLLLLAAGLVALVSPSWSLALTSTVLGTRVGVAIVASHVRGRGLAGAPIEWLLADTVLLWAFLRALGRPRVAWRSQMLTLNRSGRLSAACPSSPSNESPNL